MLYLSEKLLHKFTVYAFKNDSKEGYARNTKYSSTPLKNLKSFQFQIGISHGVEFPIRKTLMVAII